MQIVAIIPARGGSKRIPRKNVRDFLGKPLINYSIEKAINSKIFSDVFVSTDDDEIAQISIDAGAKVPFIRKLELADDKTVTIDVISDFVEQMKMDEEDIVCCIYATAPLLKVESLHQGLQLFLEAPSSDYSCAVTKFNYPIERALKKSDDGLFNMIFQENLQIRSQEFSESFHDAGQFYFARATTWLKRKPMLNNTNGIVLPSWNVQDIDTEEDWKRCEILYELNMRLNEENQLFENESKNYS